MPFPNSKCNKHIKRQKGWVDFCSMGSWWGTMVPNHHKYVKFFDYFDFVGRIWWFAMEMFLGMPINKILLIFNTSNVWWFISPWARSQTWKDGLYKMKNYLAHHLGQSFLLVIEKQSICTICILPKHYESYHLMKWFSTY
jgi:hypothetical protein